MVLPEGLPTPDQGWGNVTSPYVRAVLATPSDTADEERGISRGLYVGGAGNADVVMANGDAVLYTGLLVGRIYPITVKRINATGLTASLLILLY